MKKIRSSKVDLVGQKFGKFTVISLSGKTKNCHYKYLCKCDCGNIKEVLQTSLIAGRSKSCGCMKRPNWKGYGEIPGSFFNDFKRNSAGEKSRRKLRRNIDFSITIEYMWELFLQQNKKCALTGIELIMRPARIRTASIDRIDCKKGYTTENVQWVHKDINRMKNIFDQEYFIETCKKVSKLYQ